MRLFKSIFCFFFDFFLDFDSAVLVESNNADFLNWISAEWAIRCLLKHIHGTILANSWVLAVHNDTVSLVKEANCAKLVFLRSSSRSLMAAFSCFTVIVIITWRSDFVILIVVCFGEITVCNLNLTLDHLVYEVEEFLYSRRFGDCYLSFCLGSILLLKVVSKNSSRIDLPDDLLAETVKTQV